MTELSTTICSGAGRGLDRRLIVATDVALAQDAPKAVRHVEARRPREFRPGRPGRVSLADRFCLSRTGMLRSFGPRFSEVRYNHLSSSAVAT